VETGRRNKESKGGRGRRFFNAADRGLSGLLRESIGIRTENDPKEGEKRRRAVTRSTVRMVFWQTKNRSRRLEATRGGGEGGTSEGKGYPEKRGVPAHDREWGGTKLERRKKKPRLV